MFEYLRDYLFHAVCLTYVMPKELISKYLKKNNSNIFVNLPTGWQGQNCSEDIDECSTLVPSQKHQCVPGQGNCENSEGGYRCECEPGYTGDFCQTDIDECETQPCLSGGTCTDRVNNFTCDCSDTGMSGIK